MKTLGQWRAEKEALDRGAKITRGQSWVRNDQRRNLDSAYERSWHRHRHEGGPEPVSRAVWRDRLDKYLRDYWHWKAGLIAEKPAKPGHCATEAQP